jgi:hypothetical protein
MPDRRLILTRMSLKCIEFLNKYVIVEAMLILDGDVTEKHLPSSQKQFQFVFLPFSVVAKSGKFKTGFHDDTRF